VILLCHGTACCGQCFYFSIYLNFELNVVGRSCKSVRKQLSHGILLNEANELSSNSLLLVERAVASYGLMLLLTGTYG